MNATPAKSQTAPRLSRAELRERWRQLADNRVVAAIPCRVELNEKGAIEVSPPTVRHAFVQGFLTRELARQRPEGRTLPECPVETDIGMRVPDVVWGSPELMERHRDEQQFRVAPDLCVEVLSPTNTRIEMEEKTAAYLAAGAKEVWIVDEDGVPEIHTVAGRVPQSTLGSAARTGFFFWISVLLLAFLVIGFAPSLYLRAFFEVPPIPGYLHVHGAILTSWFLWLVLQTSMVRTGRTATHRRLGVIGAVIAVAVVFAGPMATVGAVGRLREAGFDWDTDMSALSELGVEGVPMIRFMAQVVWGNFVSIVVFAVLVAAALLLRRHSDTHKRLMVLASIAIVGPALARISRWPVLGGEDGAFIPSVLLALLIAVIAHDIVTMRRVHKATIYGTAALIGGTIVQQLIADSEFGRSVVRMLA